MSFFVRKFITFSVLSVAICIEKRLPKLDLIVFGLYNSVFGFAIIKPSIPAASAVLNKAPIFPGFSGDSTTKI